MRMYAFGAFLFFGAACVTQTDPPTWVTPLGINVYLFGQRFTPEAVDETFERVIREFSNLYDSDRARAAASRASISFLPLDSYDLYGQQVAGNVSPDATFIYIGAKTRRLPQTALVHEWIHFLDMHLHGETDSSHASWNERIYPGIERINALMDSEFCSREECAP